MQFGGVEHTTPPLPEEAAAQLVPPKSSPALKPAHAQLRMEEPPVLMLLQTRLELCVQHHQTVSHQPPRLDITVKTKSKMI